jgi:predicted HicB family RNase H-like nuclease
MEDKVTTLTIRIPEKLKREVQAEAVLSGTNLTNLIIDHFQEWLEQRREGKTSLDKLNK